MVTLWHGTTVSAAKLIAAEGFARADTVSVVKATAVGCGVDPAGLLTTLQAAHRFVLIQDRRDDAVWFATSKKAADKWAQRAPEARWEALWGVWWLTHGGYDASPTPWGDTSAAAWHASHFFADAPAVLQVRVPVSRLQDRYKAEVPVHRAAEFVKHASEVSVTYPVPAEWIVGCEVTPRRVDFVAAAGLLGLTTIELAQRADAGEMAACKPPDVPGLGSWYWDLNDLLPYLPTGSANRWDAPCRCSSQFQEMEPLASTESDRPSG